MQGTPLFEPANNSMCVDWRVNFCPTRQEVIAGLTDCKFLRSQGGKSAVKMFARDTNQILDSFAFFSTGIIQGGDHIVRHLRIHRYIRSVDQDKLVHHSGYDINVQLPTFPGPANFNVKSFLSYSSQTIFPYTYHHFYKSGLLRNPDRKGSECKSVGNAPKQPL